MIRNKFLTKICSIFFPFLFAGCNNSDATIFVYEKQVTDNNKYIDLQLLSSEYTDNTLKIKFKKSDNELNVDSNNIKVQCYDKDFNKIKQESKVTLEKNILTIENDKAHEISGIILRIQHAKYAIRYLDSKSYSILAYYFLSDVGEKEFGDVDTYYSEAEKKKQQEEIDRRKANSNRAFEYIMGVWESEDKKFGFETHDSDKYPGNKQLAFSRFNEETQKLEQYDWVISDKAFYDTSDENLITISVSTGNMTAPIILKYNTQTRTLSSFIEMDKPMHKISD